MKKAEPKKSPSVLSDLTNSTVAVASFLSLIIIGFAIWMQVQATLNPQPGMEFGFMVFYPLVLFASLILLINGLILLARAAFRRNLKKSYRITFIIMGLLFLFPAGYLVQGFVSATLVERSTHVITPNEEMLKMAQDCKIQTVRREYLAWSQPVEERKSTAKAYLKDWAKSQAEKDSYFYHKSFDPAYYDELAKAINSDELQKKCGKVELYDENREAIPTSYNWLTVAEAKDALNACQISNLITLEKPAEGLTETAGGTENKPVGVFLALDPISEGYSGKLYITQARQADFDTLLDFAKSKKGSCRYKQPNIDGKE